VHIGCCFAIAHPFSSLVSVCVMLGSSMEFSRALLRDFTGLFCGNVGLFRMLWVCACWGLLHAPSPHPFPRASVCYRLCVFHWAFSRDFIGLFCGNVKLFRMLWVCAGRGVLPDPSPLLFPRECVRRKSCGNAGIHIGLSCGIS